jgi:site-specific DNA recombinase
MTDLRGFLPFEYVRKYHEERKRLAAETDAKRSGLTCRLSELDREIDRLVDEIAKGHGDPAILGPRSTALYQERKRIAEELNSEPPIIDIISLHLATLARYQQQLADLQNALVRGVRAGDEEAASAIGNPVATP